LDQFRRAQLCGGTARKSDRAPALPNLARAVHVLDGPQFGWQIAVAIVASESRPKRPDGEGQPNANPNSQPITIHNQLAVNSPRLYLDAAPIDARTHPSAPAPSLPSGTQFVTITAAELTSPAGQLDGNAISVIVNRLKESGISQQFTAASSGYLASSVLSLDSRSFAAVTISVGNFANSDIGQYVILRPQRRHTHGASASSSAAFGQ